MTTAIFIGGGSSWEVRGDCTEKARRLADSS